MRRWVALVGLVAVLMPSAALVPLSGARAQPPYPPSPLLCTIRLFQGTLLCPSTFVFFFDFSSGALRQSASAPAIPVTTGPGAVPVARTSRTTNASSGPTVAMTLNDTPLGTITVTVPHPGAGVTLTTTVESNNTVIVSASPAAALGGRTLTICSSTTYCQTVGFDPRTGTAQARY